MKLQLSLLFPVFLTLGVCHSAVLKQNSQNSLASTDPIVVSDASQRRSNFTVNSQISSIASKKPSIGIDARLFSRTQMFLQIASDGTVNGTLNRTSKYAQFRLQSMTTEHKRIKATETGRYVAMDNKGNVYSTSSPNDETIFKETMEGNWYYTFASAKYYRTTPDDLFISIGRNGKARNGAETNSSQKKVQFLILTKGSF